MSCRTTTEGSLSTTYVQKRYGLLDAQATSLFHQLRRGHSTAEDTTELRESYRTLLDTVHAYIEANRQNWTAGFTRKALARLDNARNAGFPIEQRNAYAAAMLPLKANELERQLDEDFAVLAAQHGVSQSKIRKEFKRLHRKAIKEEANRLPHLASPYSDDWQTRWALNTLKTGTRCTNCGQFTSHSGTHDCPRNTTVSSPITTSPRQGQDIEASTDYPKLSEDMEEFQKLYDNIKERQSSRLTSPLFPELERTPGFITGGLALPNVGTTFGVELEFDFPYDDYPYMARQEFASILYEDSIAIDPNPNRWHFIGDVGADRPGGEFTVTPYNWSVERDSSVDGLNGERGVEIKSQILYDEPETWENIKRICEVANSLGGKPTPRCGLHVNIGVQGFPPDDTTAHTNLIKLAIAYDDTLVRLSHNPMSGEIHRGRRYCLPISSPVENFQNVDQVRRYSNHYEMLNFHHAPSLSNPLTRSSRIEMRLFDSSLDPGRIQAQVALTLGLAAAAKNNIPPGQDPEYAGSHRETYGTRKLSGTRWEESTLSFRRLVDILASQGLNRPEHREMFTWLFAATRWQRPG